MREAAPTPGHFARKQLFSRSRLIAWSHRSRFETAWNWVEAPTPQRVLDYGCGDGTFLEHLADRTVDGSHLVGAELDPRVIRANRARLSPAKCIQFIHQSELVAPEYNASFDWIVCMEVLEHVMEPERVLRSFSQWLSPSGRLLISVPVETGPALLAKQCLRRLAGWRGIGDYQFNARYSWRELATAFLAKDTPHLNRSVHRHDDGTPFHDHKGFNWRVLRNHLTRHFEILETRTSPLRALPPGCNSQVWFSARKRSVLIPSPPP